MQACHLAGSKESHQAGPAAKVGISTSTTVPLVTTTACQQQLHIIIRKLCSCWLVKYAAISGAPYPNHIDCSFAVLQDELSK